MEKGYTLVPTKVYLSDGLVKVEVGVAKGKKNYDKREVLKQKTIIRSLQREVNWFGDDMVSTDKMQARCKACGIFLEYLKERKIA